MWYKYAKVCISGTQEEYLKSLGVPDHVIAWIGDQNPDHQKIYVNIVRNKPNATIEEIQNLANIKTEQNQQSNFESNLYMRYQNIPQFAKWLLIQVKKMRLDPNGRKYAIDNLEIINQADAIKDWYNYEIARHPLDDQGQSRFQLSSYDWASAVKMSEEWHTMMAGKGSGLMYEPISPANVVYDYDDGYTMQLVTSENDLRAEGNKMNHCVGTYCDDVKEGKYQIFSLRDETNHPVATIRMNEYGEISEIKGHSNRVLSEDYQSYIKEWVENLPVQKWEESLITKEFNLDGVDMKSVADHIDQYGAEIDQYGLAQDTDFTKLDVLYAVENTLDKFENTWGQLEDRYADDAAYSLLKILAKRDEQLAEKRKFDKYYWNYTTSYDEVDSFFEDYKNKAEKELKDEIYYLMPEEPENNFEDEDEYEEEMEKWQSQFDSLLDRKMSSWERDDLRARFLTILINGLKINNQQVREKIRKFRELYDARKQLTSSNN